MIIPLKGIQDGEHEFCFEIGQALYQDYPESEISDGQVTFNITMKKRPNIINIAYQFTGKLTVPCDKCLDLFEQEVEGSGTLVVKFSGGADEGNDELLILPDSESELDLTHFAYETTVLSLPYRKVHNLDKNGVPACNPEMLKRINEHESGEKNETIDPRWEKLKQLKNYN